METETSPMTVARCMPQSVLYTIWTAKKVLGFVYTARLARESASRFNPLPSERLQHGRSEVNAGVRSGKVTNSSRSANQIKLGIISCSFAR